jgi:hypothetical protein
MFIVYFQYLAYQVGDELLDMDSLTTPPNPIQPTGVLNEATGNSYLLAYPNPFNQQVNIDYYLETESEVSLQIYDIQGRAVRTLTNSQLLQGRQTLSWDGRSDSGSDLSNGLYLIYLKAEGKISTQKVMLSK